MLDIGFQTGENIEKIVPSSINLYFIENGENLQEIDISGSHRQKKLNQ